MNETCYVLLGLHRGGFWVGRLRQRQTGKVARVEFDWEWVLDREERRGDIAGFYHTHPAGLAVPSARDVRTMRAWVSCLGKPQLCVIQSGKMPALNRTEGLAAYVFATDRDSGQAVARVARFARNMIVAVGGAND